MKTNRLKSILALGALSVLAFSTTGCSLSRTGGEIQTSTKGAMGSSGQGQTQNPGNFPVVPPVITQPLNPVFTSVFSITGINTTHAEVPAQVGPINTDKVLKIRVRAEAASNNSNGFPYTENYSCVKYTITVLGQTVMTQVLSPNGGNFLCPNAPRTQDFDFSARAQQNPGNIIIKISSPRTDTHCNWYIQGLIPGTFNNYCTANLYTVIYPHVVNGSIDVEYDGTTSL